MAEPTKQEEKDLKPAFAVWVDARGINLVDLAGKMGYGYTYIWSLVRGSAPVTDTLLGRFARVFGPAEVGRLLELAGYSYQEVL